MDNIYRGTETGPANADDVDVVYRPTRRETDSSLSCYSVRGSRKRPLTASTLAVWGYFRPYFGCGCAALID